jgi:hypothetical protein
VAVRTNRGAGAEEDGGVEAWPSSRSAIAVITRGAAYLPVAGTIWMIVLKRFSFAPSTTRYPADGWPSIAHV